MDKYKFKFGINERGNYAELFKNGEKLLRVPGINDMEWVRYEDVKGLELQVATLTEQLSKMERKPIENEIIDKIQILNLKPNDILTIKLNCRISHESETIMLKDFDEALKKNGFNNDVFVLEDGAELQITRKDKQ